MIGRGLGLGWLPEEARRRREMEAQLIDLLHFRGFREVGVPLLETGSEGHGPHMADGSGSVLSLRSDFTRAVSKMAVSTLADHPRPLQLAYSGVVFRAVPGLDRGMSEIWQVGGEVVGEQPEADSDVMALAVDGVASLSCPGEARIIIGDVSLLRRLLAGVGFNAPQRRRVEALLAEGDLTGLEEHLTGTVGQRDSVRALMDLLIFAGNREETTRRWVRAGGEADCLEPMLGLGERFEDAAAYSLGLARELDYYTGPLFVVYAGHHRVPVAQGGRYDGLLKTLGRDEPATGFGWNLDSLLLVSRHTASRVSVFPGIH